MRKTFNISHSQKFLEDSPSTCTKWGKNYNLDYIKIRNFCSAKDIKIVKAIS